MRIYSVDFAEVRLAIPQSKLDYLELPGPGGTAFNSAEGVRSNSAGSNSARSISARSNNADGGGDGLEADAPGDAEAAAPPQVTLYTEVNGEITRWPARLHRTEAALDERSRVLFTVARVDDPYALREGADHPPLRIGTFVKATITGKLMTGIVPLPRYVLRAGNQIWVVDDELRLQSRQVSTLRTAGDEVYVTRGLREGELVSLTIISDPLPGMAVTINSRRAAGRGNGGALEAAEPAPAAPARATEPAAPARPAEKAPVTPSPKATGAQGAADIGSAETGA